MEQKRGLSERKDLVVRSRINDLFSQGLSYPLLTVLAGPGYGKTKAASIYFDDSDVRLVWLRLTAFDNLRTSFWDSFIKAAEKEIPELSARLRNVPFPESYADAYSFLQEFSSLVYRGKQVVCLIDNLGLIDNPQILNFFKMMADAELENFCLVLISTVKSALDLAGGSSTNKFCITGDDLRFTKSEISALFQLHNIFLRPDELRQIEEYTAGWALPLYLLISQYDEAEGFCSLSERITDKKIDQMFEQRFFEHYSTGIKELLIKLSFLEKYSMELLYEFYDGDRQDLKVLEDNVFFLCGSSMQLNHFHHLYKGFLQGKSYLVAGDERTAFLKKVADFYSRTGNYIDAIICYRKCGDLISMLESTAEFVHSQETLSVEKAEFILEHIELLNEDQRRERPVADLLRAHSYLNILDFEKSEKILLDLERRLLGAPEGPLTELLGEVYCMIGGMHMMRSQEDFGDYFKKAAFYLPDGSKFQNKSVLRSGNNHSFSMSDSMPGAKERMARAVVYGVSWATKALSGGMCGLDSLFLAEAAFLSYDFTEAKKHAYHAIYKAREKKQHDLLCNAHCLLGRIAYMRGDFDELLIEVNNVVEYADKHDIKVINEIRDTTLAWYYVKMDDYEKVPRWLLTTVNHNQPMLSNSRAMLVYANYLLRIGEFENLIALLENPTGLYLTDGIWTDRLYLLSMLAIGYQCLERDDRALELLWQLYNITYSNHILTVFIEGGKYMRRLIQSAQKQDMYAFDANWLETVYAKSNTFSKKLISMQNIYNKGKTGAQKNLRELSKREKDILTSLSQGLTREEMASFYSISINTVKSILANIYSKLGAVNRADAIYIAITEGFLE